ncbi:MAG: hypothetical protein DRQ88_08615 [Epsilonproteobacteria bacterium]|nr:MAG: hypothetical protein DRQ89_08130 [Campylobacterota bacterium]RLA65752.1 MAG: hypothetical protein DRQ88_08615 [Campylobacterota bacterium]
MGPYINFLETVPENILSNVQDLKLNIELDNCNREIEGLLSRTVLDGGKRLRPMLTHLMGRLFGLEVSLVDPYAKAVEMVHAASLSHDDVIDNATQRRGEPSINIEGSNKMAVLAGDYLLADVIVSLSNRGNLQLVGEMAKVIQDLSEGEWIQDSAAKKRNYTRDLIEKIALKKTASVMTYCCLAPAILAKAPQELQDLAVSFGRNLGIAFQLMDDTLDLSDYSKKDVLLDLKNGVVNSVIYEWLLFNPVLHEQYKNGESLENLWNGKDIERSIAIVQERAFGHLLQAKNSLDTIVDSLTVFDREGVKAAKLPLEKILFYLGRREF